MSEIKEALKREFESVFKMLEDAVSRIEGEFWKEKKNNWMYGYVLFHTIEALEYYLSDSPKEWEPLTEVTQYSEEKETLSLQKKDKAFFKDHLEKVKEKMNKTLEKMEEKDLLENDGFEERGFTSRLHKYIYVIRHCMVHLGELSKTLRNRGERTIRWK